LKTARISYLLSRLNPNYHDEKHSTQQCLASPLLLRDSNKPLLCDSEQYARDLLHDIRPAGGDNTGQIVTVSKNQQPHSIERQEYNRFIGYAKFLEEAVSGYAFLKRPNQNDPTMTRLPTFAKGRFVSCSPEHTVLRMGGDVPMSGVATFGVGSRGQLGHGSRDDEKIPRRMRHGIGYSIRVVQVAAGGGLARVAHSLLLTDTGRVLSFGTGSYGALGHGYSAAKQLPDYLRPAYIQALNFPCACVAAGELHSAVVAADGDVYTFGDSFCGQCGHGDKRPQVLPKQVTTGGLDDECVANISCGGRHTLAVTEDGELFSWGLGRFGALGRPYTPFEYDENVPVAGMPVDLDGEQDQNFLRAQELAIIHNPQPRPAVPRDETAELQAHLDLIANLSLDDGSNQCIPTLVESLKGIQIIGASAGHRHSLVLDGNGHLYSFGWGGGGCLGHGDTSPQMFPCRIQAFDEDKIRIMQISAGVDMSMVVSSTGDVYAWGKTDGGRCGLGMAKTHVTQPRRVYWTDGIQKAVDVECGYVHSIIVGLNGTFHQCGGVGVHGAEDGQENDDEAMPSETQQQQQQPQGRPRLIDDVNIWHRLPEPREEVQKVVWKKPKQYEIKGRSKMMSGQD
jgi:alpha-tubulin suppressor-like RCC1 family protein